MNIRKPTGTKPKKPDPLDGLPQIERFKIVAQELGCEDDETTFRTNLGRIGRYKPKAGSRGEPSDKQ